MSQWLGREAPRALVVDVSVEVVLLSRLHGVPTVAVVAPGRRTDPPHLTAFRAASALVGAWPEAADADGAMTPGLPPDVAERLRRVGGVSRHSPGVVREPRRAGVRHAVVLQGTGGGTVCDRGADALAAGSLDWRWTVLGAGRDWVPDPMEVLRDADVVVCAAGQGSLADVAASRRPAVVLPLPRPHEEQACTAAALAQGGWPVVVARTPEQAVDPAVLDRAAQLDASAWQHWCDGHGADRFAAVIDEVALPRPHHGGPARPGVPGVPA